MTASVATFKRLKNRSELAVPIGRRHFAVGLHRDDSAFSGLTNMARGLAMDHARIKLDGAGLVDFTDSSTGVAATAVAALTIPTAAFDGTSAGASPAAAFITAAGVVANAFAVVADSLDNALVRVGREQIRWATGTVATAATIPAMTKALSATSGATAIDFTTGVAAMTVMRNNLATLVNGANMLAAALGEATLADSSGGTPILMLAGSALPYITMPAIVAPTAGTGDTAGLTSISDTVMDAFLDGLANAVATIAQFVNNLVGVVSTTALTDSSGGTAAASISAMAIPAAAAGAATTSSPKAGFDAQLVIENNALCELMTKVNSLRLRNGLAAYTDSTADTANGTIEAMSVGLTAVDGSSGTNAVDQLTGRARLSTLRDNLATVAAAVNEVLPFYGEQALVDNSGGTPSTTVAALAATGTGVGAATAVTLLDADVDALLVLIRHAFASLAAKVNACIGANVAAKGLHVVAV